MVQLLSPALFTFLFFISSVASAPAEAPPASSPEIRAAEAEVEARACAPSAANKATLKLIEGFEGWSAKAYKDPTGHPTIGWGHLCKSSSCKEIGYKIPLSKADGEKLLNKDLLTARKCISSQIKDNIKLNPNQYGALVSWAFNVGCGNTGSSTLIKRLNKKESPNKVAAAELPKWNKSNNKVLPGLTRRRKAEVALFKTKASGVAHPPKC